MGTADIYARGGYTLPVKVFSGNVAGKERGILPFADASVGFYYVHTLIQSFATGGGILSTDEVGGFWTIQIRASKAADSPVLFEQSVYLGAEIIGGLGGLISTWFVLATSDHKFKTRICDGQILPPVIEPYAAGDPQPSRANDQVPAIPEQPRFWNVKVTDMRVQAPPMPEKATSLKLQWAASRNGPWTTADGGDNLSAGAHIDVHVTNLGFSSNNRAVAATELIWWRAVAVNASGETAGPAVRDIWNGAGVRSDLNGQLAMISGYEGYKYADAEHPTVFYEQSFVEDTSASGQNFGVRLTGTWVSPLYKCNIPGNAYLDIISDAWVGQISNNDIYYSVGRKAGGGFDATRDSATGCFWGLYGASGDLRIVRHRDTYFPRKISFNGQAVQPLPLAGDEAEIERRRIVNLRLPQFDVPVAPGTNFWRVLKRQRFGEPGWQTSPGANRSPDLAVLFDRVSTVSNSKLQAYESTGDDGKAGIYITDSADEGEHYSTMVLIRRATMLDVAQSVDGDTLYILGRATDKMFCVPAKASAAKENDIGDARKTRIARMDELNLSTAASSSWTATESGWWAEEAEADRISSGSVFRAVVRRQADSNSSGSSPQWKLSALSRVSFLNKTSAPGASGSNQVPSQDPDLSDTAVSAELQGRLAPGRLRLMAARDNLRLILQNDDAFEIFLSTDEGRTFYSPYGTVS